MKRPFDAPHSVPVPVLLALIGLADALCRLPIAPVHGIAGALATTAALALGVTLLLALTARLAACPAGNRPLVACGLAAAILAFLLRATELPWRSVELAFDVALVTAAAALGRLFANEVLQLWWIVPLGLTGAMADLVSVFVPGAPTNELLATGSPVLEYLLLVWPAFHPAPSYGFCGVSDIAIAAILYGLTVRYELPAFRSFALLAAALMMCLVLAGVAGAGLPAIPFLFFFWVAGNARPLVTSWRART